MPAGACWRWLEAYGQLECDVDGLSYEEAVRESRKALDGLIAPGALDEEMQARGELIAHAQGEIVCRGSGWGSLENMRRQKAGLPPLSAVCRFPTEDLTSAQQPWLSLLNNGVFPEADAACAPESYLVSACWREQLEQVQQHWLSAYHLGVMRYVAGDKAGAEQAMHESLAHADNAWAHRALARFAGMSGNTCEQLAQYQAALALNQDDCLRLEYAQALDAAQEHSALAAYIEALPQETQVLPRFQYLRASAAIALEEYDLAERILRSPLIIPDMREGELSLCSLWFALFEKKYQLTTEEVEKRFPLPRELDFRMH